jgi:hypothetical protein
MKIRAAHMPRRRVDQVLFTGTAGSNSARGKSKQRKSRYEIFLESDLSTYIIISTKLRKFQRRA